MNIELTKQQKQLQQEVRTYMQVDPRRDHSFRVPRPDLTEKLGVPNTCNTCHADQTPRWAAQHIEKWYPDSERRKQTHYGEILAAADAGHHVQDAAL